MTEKTENMLREILTEEHTAPCEINQKLHCELIKLERKIIIRNIIIAVFLVFSVTFFAVSLTYIFSGSLTAIIGILFFSLISAAMSVILAVSAGKYEINNLLGGLV